VKPFIKALEAEDCSSLVQGIAFGEQLNLPLAIRIRFVEEVIAALKKQNTEKSQSQVEQMRKVLFHLGAAQKLFSNPLLEKTTETWYEFLHNRIQVFLLTRSINIQKLIDALAHVIIVIKRIDAVKLVLDTLREEHLNVHGSTTTDSPMFMSITVQKAYMSTIQLILNTIEKYVSTTELTV
jgi:hypothetical protein